MSLRQSAFLFALPLFVLHCGGDGDGGSPQAPSASAVTLAEYERRSTLAYCGGYDACCRKGGSELSEAATCATDSDAYLAAQRVEAEKRGLTFDGAVAGECLAVLETAIGACRRPTDAELSACSLVFHGAKAQGDDCNETECGRTAGGQLLRCARLAASSGSPRSCQPVSAREADLGVAARAGDSCVTTCTVDADGGSGCYTVGGDTVPAGVKTCYTNDKLFCDDGKCVVQQGKDAPCRSDDACGEGFRCTALEVCATGTPGCGEPGTCVPDLAIGDACDPKAGECPKGAYCGEGNVCAARKAVGDVCNPSYNECLTNRCDAGVCNDPDDLTRSSVCKK